MKSTLPLSAPAAQSKIPVRWPGSRLIAGDGHEFSLTIFEVLVFSFTDLFTGDFLISALVTYIVTKAIAVIRYTLGKKNLATKTLIDRRFLI